MRRDVYKVLLIDSLSLFFRAYHALPKLSKGDLELEGVYGFTKMIIRALKDIKPTHVFAFFDKGRSGRDQRYKAYKSNRPEATPSIKQQVKLTEEILESLEIPVLAMPGYEADDLIASLLRRLSQLLDTRNVMASYLVFTGDKDLLSLLKYPNVHVLLVRRGVTEYESYDKMKFQREYGFPPELYPFFKAIVGDPSDNIKGVPGIGEKRGRDLINQAMELSNYPSSDIWEFQRALEKLLEAKGRDYRETFLSNLEVVRLKEDLELPDLNELLKRASYKGIDKPAFKEKLRELGFKSILRMLGENSLASRGVQGKLFS